MKYSNTTHPRYIKCIKSHYYLIQCFHCNNLYQTICRLKIYKAYFVTINTYQRIHRLPRIYLIHRQLMPYNTERTSKIDN